MKKQTLSYQKKKRLKNLPEIKTTSNINLSINNTFVLIRNNTQENLPINKNNNLPNIFTNNFIKKKTIFSPLKFTKTKNTTNIHTITLKKKNSEKSEKEINPMHELMMSNKILGKFLYFFNIRELLVLMNINKKINIFIKNTDAFKKYINIKNDLKKGTLFKDTKKGKILKNNLNNISYRLSTGVNFNYNNNTNRNINSFLKYNLLTKNKIKLTKIVNKKDLSPFHNFQNDNKSISNLKLTSFTNMNDTSRNSLISSKTGSSKFQSQSNKKEEFEFNDNNLNIKKLKIKLLYLIRNNGNKISLIMLKYKLNFIETKIIFNGIIESLILKSLKESNNKFDSDSLILNMINPEKYIDLYLDPILNLDFIKIRKINFNNVIISSLLIMKKISNIISRNCENIKILSLQNNNINDSYAKILFKSIKFNRDISILNLEHNQISNKSIIYLEPFLKYNNSLNSLILSYNYLSSNGCNILMDFLKENKNSNLKTLDISYNGIDEEGMESLTEYIKLNKNLMTLFLSGNYLCDKGINKLSNLLFDDNNNTKKVKLSYLDISNNSFTKNSYKYINNIIFNSSFITSINISYNNLYNESIFKIFSCINKQNKLVSLDLSKTNIDEKSIEFICQKLDKSINLRILNLSYNNLNKACKCIKSLLLKETNLKVLKLKSCQIISEANLIFQGLSNNKGLQTFDISNNNLYIDNNLIKDLKIFFQENRKLNNLIMDNDNIDDILMNFISNFLVENKSLKIISLKNNRITNNSAIVLMNNLQKYENIRKIELEGNLIDSEIKQQINILLNEKLNSNKN